MTLACAALVVAAAVAALGVTLGAPAVVVLPIAGLGLVLLAVGLALGVAGFIPWAIAMLGAEYAAALELERSGSLDWRVPLVAAGLLATAELGYWSLERRTPIQDERGLVVRRAAVVVMLCAGAALLASLLAGVTAVRVAGGLGWDIAGAAAAAAALALVAALARRA